MLREVAPPVVEPITLDELKTHLRTSPTINAEEDAYLQALIVAARQYAENYCSRPLVPRLFDIVRDSFAETSVAPLSLEIGSVLAVVSVTYRDPDHAVQTLDPLDYRLVPGQYKSYLLPAADVVWPPTEVAIDAVTVRVLAGFESQTSPESGDGVPGPIKQAILMICGDLYENREAIIVGTIRQENEAVKSMLHFYRVEIP